MTAQCETRPPAGEREPRNDFDKTHSTSSNGLLEVQTSMIRGLFGLPARRVRELIATLEPRDCTLAAWEVLEAIKEATESQIEGGFPGEPPSPVRIMTILQNAGQYSAPVRATLEAATIGAWPAPCEVDTMDAVRSLTVLRARRAAESWGTQLAASATSGSLDDLRRDMGRFEAVERLFVRAGLASEKEAYNAA